MKRVATLGSQSGASSTSRRYKYTKVLDNRKHAIRGLWRRNGKVMARITVEDDAGRKRLKWVPLTAATAAAAQEEFRTLLVERGEDRLRHIGRCPNFSDYVAQTYEARLVASGKKPDTLVTKRVHLKQLGESLGHLFLDKIRTHHVTGHLQRLKERGLASDGPELKKTAELSDGQNVIVINGESGTERLTRALPIMRDADGRFSGFGEAWERSNPKELGEEPKFVAGIELNESERHAALDQAGNLQVVAEMKDKKRKEASLVLCSRIQWT